MDDLITKQLLYDHFAGRLTALQRSHLEKWLQVTANRELYYELLEEWERHNLQYLAPTEKALHQSLHQIDELQESESITENQQLQVVRPSLSATKWTRLVAASVVLCLLAGLYSTRTFWLSASFTTAYGEVQHLTLPDGSKVTLNANSRLTYPRFGFGTHSREVTLTGEATFLVTHTPSNQRFVVHTPKGVKVIVLGTEFNVFARPRATQVALRRGRVQLNYETAPKKVKRLVMESGDLFSLDQKGKSRILHNTRVDDLMAWKQHRFVFSQTSMTEIRALIEENYNIKVKLKNPQLAQRTVSGTFEANSADEFLQVIAELLEINYTRRGNSVTFFE